MSANVNYSAWIGSCESFKIHFESRMLIPNYRKNPCKKKDSLLRMVFKSNTVYNSILSE